MVDKQQCMNYVISIHQLDSTQEEWKIYCTWVHHLLQGLVISFTHATWIQDRKGHTCPQNILSWGLDWTCFALSSVLPPYISSTETYVNTVLYVSFEIRIYSEERRTWELITNFFPAASASEPSASAYSYTAAGHALPSNPAYSTHQDSIKWKCKKTYP